MFTSILFYDVVGSTMDIARALPPGTVVVARQQTAGRGRMGRGWHSPPGGLWVTFVMEKTPPERAAMLFSTAVVEALGEHGVDAEIKWPNDVLVRGRKICGILGETAGEKTLIGVGINVANDPPEGVEATTMACEGAKAQPLAVLSSLLCALERLSYLPDDEVFRMWRERMCTLGATVMHGGEVWTAVDVNPDGSLILERNGIRKAVKWGEVLHVREREGL